MELIRIPVEPLPSPGVIPTSGKKIVWPDPTSEIKIEGDKIVYIKPYVDSGGMEDLIEPLGVRLPSV